MIHIKRDVHLINDLQTKMFINVDIIKSKKMIFNFQINKFIINNCDMIALLICRLFRNYRCVNYIINIQHAIIISTYIIIKMFFKFKNFSKLLIRRNFFFQFNSTLFQLNEENDVMTHVLNVKIIFVHVKNAINKLILLSKHIKLNRIINFKKKDCYATNIIDVYLIIKTN